LINWSTAAFFTAQERLESTRTNSKPLLSKARATSTFSPPPIFTLSPSDPATADESGKSEDLFRGMTRKDGLLFKLRSAPEIFPIDPSHTPLPSSNDLIGLRERYSSFLSTLPKDLVQSEMVQEEGGVEVLNETGKEVVSEREDSFSEEEFWKRCLFRVSLIEEEEEKRKKVLNGEFSLSLLRSSSLRVS